MVAKVFGLASGALVASLAVWGFNTWRHVSDDDRLTSALAEHCIPYVQTGETPFAGLGRGVGVYDDVDLDPRLKDGGAAIIFDGRFVASWGALEDPALRLCQIEARAIGADTPGFGVTADGFIDRYTQIARSLGDLRPDAERSGNGGLTEDAFFTIAWFEADKTVQRGNRIVMSVGDGRVSSAIVIRDMPG